MVHGQSAEATSASSAAAADAGDERRIDPHSGGPSSTARLPLTDRDKERMRCERGIWYHDDRERFFARLHKFLMFWVIVTGASAGAEITQTLGWFDAKYLGMAAALIGAADIAWDISGKARVHAMLKREAVTILERIEAGDEVKAIRIAIARSQADEPPIMHAVNCMAYNAVQRANDRGEHTCVEIKGWRRWMRHFAFTPEVFPDKTPQAGGLPQA